MSVANSAAVKLAIFFCWGSEIGASSVPGRIQFGYPNEAGGLHLRILDMLSISYVFGGPIKFSDIFSKFRALQIARRDLLTRKVICPCEAGEARSKSPGYNWCQHDILMNCITFYQIAIRSAHLKILCPW